MIYAAPDAAKPKPRRRWYQYSLRTLLIGVALLAVPCADVAHEARIVSERKAVLDRIRANGGEGVRAFHQRGPVPWLRGVFGDEPIALFWLPAATPAKERLRIATAYPEARIKATDPLWWPRSHMISEQEKQEKFDDEAP